MMVAVASTSCDCVLKSSMGVLPHQSVGAPLYAAAILMLAVIMQRNKNSDAAQ
jgi:hypothetical protein